MSRVDVIVPCYKYAQFLRECVESIQSQLLTDVRVLIIDDASPDHTPEVAAELAARDKRVEYRRHSVNHGHIATYNEGLEWATADYVLLLSADDLLTPGALHRATRFLDAHPEVGLAYGRHIDFDTGQTLKPVPDSAECDGWVLSYEEFLEASCKLGHTPIEAPAAIVRNRVHREVGGYRPELPHSGDTELWLRLAARAPVGVLDAEQAYRRWHGANMTFRNMTFQRCAQAPIGHLLQQQNAFDLHFRDHGDRIVNRERLQQLVVKAIARGVLVEAHVAFEYGDLSSCQELLDYALNICPELGSKPECSRLRWKRRMGPKVWSALRSIIDCLRFCTNRPKSYAAGWHPYTFGLLGYRKTAPADSHEN